MSMNNITKIYTCKKLYEAGISPEKIPEQIGVHRATVYRWIRGMKRKGYREFVRDYKRAKKGRRKRNKTPEYVKKYVYEIRNKRRRCCGEKIKFFLEKEKGIKISVSTIYIILNEKYQLRSKWKKNQKRGYVIKGERPRHVIQVDSVVLGNIYAFTSIDTYTREARVTLKEKLDSEAGKEALEDQLSYYKDIERIQRDGGPEFKKHWEKRVRRKNIKLRTSRPYKKNEQAFIERFNGILRKECVGHIHYKKEDLPELQRRVDEFLDYYHNERPHLSLNMLTPIQFLNQHSNQCRI